MVKVTADRVFISEPETHEGRKGSICLTINEAKNLVIELLKKLFWEGEY